MLGELISDLRRQALDRLRSPFFSAFSAAWLVSNWKLLFILLLSAKPIEDRIELIEEHYLQITHLLYAPAIFALIYSLAAPWMNLGVQYLQELANLRRRKHKLGVDQKFLEASFGRAQAQAQLNRILAKDQITQSQQQEIASLQQQLADQKESAQGRISAREAELEKLREEYRAISTTDKVTADQQRQEMERVMNLLENERKQSVAERAALAAELQARQKELELRIGSALEGANRIDDEELRKILVSKPFRLFHNPKVGPERSKSIEFGAEGRITQGNNKFEHTWRVKNGKLELVQQDGRIHSRFTYLAESGIFVHTGDADTRSARGQYLIPEVEPHP